MKKPVKTFQIGTGGWGWSWINILLESHACDLVGLVDVDEDALRKAREHYNLKPDMTFGSLSDAMKKTDAEAVLVIVPPKVHAEVTIQALENEMHCLVEKPFDTKTMAAAVRGAIDENRDTGKDP